MAQSIFMYLFFQTVKTHKKIFTSVSETFDDKGSNKNFINIISLNAGHCITAAEEN